MSCIKQNVRRDARKVRREGLGNEVSVTFPGLKLILPTYLKSKSSNASQTKMSPVTLAHLANIIVRMLSSNPTAAKTIDVIV